MSNDFCFRPSGQRRQCLAPTGPSGFYALLVFNFGSLIFLFGLRYSTSAYIDVCLAYWNRGRVCREVSVSICVFFCSKFLRGVDECGRGSLIFQESHFA